MMDESELIDQMKARLYENLSALRDIQGAVKELKRGPELPEFLNDMATIAGIAARWEYWCEAQLHILNKDEA